MRTAQFTRVSCDVLCIGGSGAAVSAAFMATQKGMSVALVPGISWERHRPMNAIRRRLCLKRW